MSALHAVAAFLSTTAGVAGTGFAAHKTARDLPKRLSTTRQNAHKTARNRQR